MRNRWKNKKIHIILSNKSSRMNVYICYCNFIKYLVKVISITILWFTYNDTFNVEIKPILQANDLKQKQFARQFYRGGYEGSRLAIRWFFGQILFFDKRSRKKNLFFLVARPLMVPWPLQKGFFKNFFKSLFPIVNKPYFILRFS